MDDCYNCRLEAAPDLPPREAVVRTPYWRVAHAFDSALPGWLVLVPTEHLLALHELSEPALVELGRLQGQLAQALHEVLGAQKTYLMQFSEAPGFTHLHVHLVPRMPDQPDERKGPGILGYLGAAEDARVPTAEMDRIAVDVGRRVTLG